MKKSSFLLLLLILGLISCSVESSTINYLEKAKKDHPNSVVVQVPNKRKEFIIKQQDGTILYLRYNTSTLVYGIETVIFSPEN